MIGSGLSHPRGRFRMPAGTVYLIGQAVASFAFLMLVTILPVYLIVDAGLGPFQLVIVGTVLEGTILLFEVPTGVVADTVSRRLSVVIGWAVSGLGTVLMGLSPSLTVILLAHVVWGIGYTFVSGADIAWITDEVGEERARVLYVRRNQVGAAGALAGIAAGVGLATIGLPLPIVGTGVVGLLGAAFLAVTMPEEHFTPNRSAATTLRASLTGTFRGAVRAVRARHVLLLAFVVAAIHGASTEAFDRLAVFHLLRQTGVPVFAGGLDPVLWFGLIQVVGLLLAIVVNEVVLKRVDLSRPAELPRVLVWIDGSLVVSVVAFALMGSFLAAVVLMWLVGLGRSVREPLFDAWINHGLDPQTRATANSMASQMDAFGQIGGGPAFGWIAVAASAPAAIVVAGLLRLPAVVLLSQARRRT